MILIAVDFQTGAVEQTVEALTAKLRDFHGLHEAMGVAVGERVKSHLRGLNVRSKRTNYYQRAAQGVEVEAGPEQARVRIPQRGMRLHHEGGTVIPGKSISTKTGTPTKSLSIPSANVPVANFTRLSPDQVGLLAFIPRRKNGPGATIGYLVTGREQTVETGKRAGATAIFPVPAEEGGKLMFTLVARTEHDADPGVLPPEPEMAAAATEAGRDFIAAAEYATQGGAQP